MAIKVGVDIWHEKFGASATVAEVLYETYRIEWHGRTTETGRTWSHVNKGSVRHL